MKTSTKQARNFRPALGRTALALTLVSVMGALSVPAFGDDRNGHRDNGFRNGDHRGDFRGRGPVYHPAYRHPYRYAAPVYAPAPVYYPPRPSPGFSLFFPLDVRIR
ncbi:MAG TPA: hypothetical protein VK572_06865 [Burkholderiales bacterium]|nr:hypothetical protein [Burkholderiales bacterium]